MKEEIIKSMEKSSNERKKMMLDSVYYNNKAYAYGKEKELSRIIKAMEKVDRKDFVLGADKEDAYVDTPLFIGHGQTISQPTTVARMLLLLELEKGIDVLEIGSGSGWNAALISFLIFPGKVTSIERIKELSEFAKKNFEAGKKKFKEGKAEFVFGSALDRKSKIWKGKYDRIITTAAADSFLAEELKKMGKLLNEEGLLLFPTERGAMELWKKSKGKLELVYREVGYAFVPLVK